MAVLTPRGTAVWTAAPIATPSTKLWNACPRRMRPPGRPRTSCASQCALWQCRQMTSFSRMKNTMIPVSSVENVRGALSFSSTSGRMDRSATPSSVPTA